MYSVLVLVALVLSGFATACVNDLDAAPTTPTTPAVAAQSSDLSVEAAKVEECRNPWSSQENDAVHVLVLAAAAIVRSEANDVRCGPLTTTERQCRALAIAALVDPTRFLAEPVRMAQSLRLFEWATAEGEASAGEHRRLKEAWTRLAASTRELATAETEEIRAEVLAKRANGATIAQLQLAEEDCSS